MLVQWIKSHGMRRGIAPRATGRREAEETKEAKSGPPFINRTGKGRAPTRLNARRYGRLLLIRSRFLSSKPGGNSVRHPAVGANDHGHWAGSCDEGASRLADAFRPNTTGVRGTQNLFKSFKSMVCAPANVLCRSWIHYDA